MNMAVSNAENLLSAREISQKEDLAALLQHHLLLKSPPRFIEGLDISNIHGRLAVGSVVSFVEGMPHRAGYRNYKIKTVNRVDDYGMMTELIKRRIAQGQLPDLFLVDGGKGHLSCVKQVLDRLVPDTDTHVVSIAKPEEDRNETVDKIYLPGRKNPLSLRPNHPVLLVMMRIRDEAHRRAVSYHRKLREQNLTSSELERIKGIGETKRNRLLNHFGDIHSVSRASRNALLEVPGITETLAEKIVAFFKEKNERLDGQVSKGFSR